MLWLLLAALLLVCLVALALSLLTLWRRVRVLGRQVSEVGVTFGEASGALADVQAARSRKELPCPTCGAPASAAVPSAATGTPALLRQPARGAVRA